jgi:drug/metabolite transporter (DMT)-like permease
VSISSASLLTLPLAVATAPTVVPGLRAVLSVLCLGAIGTATAFVIFYKLMQEIGPARASLVSYLAPGVALFYGALLLDEAITPAAIAGLVLILAGVAIAARPKPVPPEVVPPERAVELAR